MGAIFCQKDSQQVLNVTQVCLHITDVSAYGVGQRQLRPMAGTGGAIALTFISLVSVTGLAQSQLF